MMFCVLRTMVLRCEQISTPLREKKLLQDGTATMRACKKIIRECKRRKVPIVLENPRDSLMFWAHSVKECLGPLLRPAKGERTAWG